MPTVTSLEPQKNNPQRYNIYLDEEFAFGIDEENLVKFGLHKGLELSQEEVNTIFEESELFKLYSRALDFLSYRPRSEREVRNYLREKVGGFKLSVNGDAAISTIIKRLKELKFLNDRAFVEWWIKQRTEAAEPRGPHYIRSELYQKGVDGKLIERVWQELEIDEYELCLKAAQNRASRYNLTDFKQRKKFFDYLVRRGFNFDIIQAVIEKI